MAGGWGRGAGGGAGALTLIACALVLTFATLRAQTSTGTITGRVVDEHGNPIPGVLLLLIGMETRSLPLDVTDATGAIRLPPLRAGDYKLIARLDAFDASSATAVRDVVVTGDQTTAVGDVPLVVARRRREADAPVASTVSAANSMLPQTSEWSAAVDGVSGRLIVTPHMDGDGPQARIELALENRNSDDVFVFWWPLIYQ